MVTTSPETDLGNCPFERTHREIKIHLLDAFLKGSLVCPAGKFWATTAKASQSRRNGHSPGGAGVTLGSTRDPTAPEWAVAVRRHRKPSDGKTQTWRKLCLSSFPSAGTQTHEAFIPLQPSGALVLSIGCYKFLTSLFSHKHFFFSPQCCEPHPKSPCGWKPQDKTLDSQGGRKFGGWQAGRQSRFLGDSLLMAGLNHPFPPASFLNLLLNSTRILPRPAKALLVWPCWSQPGHSGYIFKIKVGSLDSVNSHSLKLAAVSKNTPGGFHSN